MTGQRVSFGLALRFPENDFMATTKRTHDADREDAKTAYSPGKLRFLNAGDRARAICGHCSAMRDIEYQYRPLVLEKTKITVPNVLVGVCLECDDIVSIPAQSTPRIKAARQRQMKEQNARISLELEDRLNVIAAEVDARPEPFKGALFRYALARVVSDKRFARQVWKQAHSPHQKGTAGARVKFRADVELPQQAMAAAEAAGIYELSAILRGAILTVDELLSRPTQRAALKRDLRLLAVGSGA